MRIAVVALFLVLVTTCMFYLNGCVSQQSALSHVEISEIIVLDSHFKTLKIINQPEQLLSINEIWKQLKPINKLPNSNWTYKLDIESNHMSGCWLYNKEGYLAKLNYQLEPKYRVEDPNKFNMLILGNTELAGKQADIGELIYIQNGN